MKDRSRYTRLKLTEKFEVMELLKQNLEKDDEGCWVYKNGLSDDHILRLVAIPNANRDHIASVRKEIYGALRSKKQDEAFSIAKRLGEMERAIADLQHLIGTTSVPKFNFQR